MVCKASPPISAVTQACSVEDRVANKSCQVTPTANSKGAPTEESGVDAAVGSGVGGGVGRGVGVGVGAGVGAGVGSGVATGVGAGVGAAVGVGAGVGAGVEGGAVGATVAVGVGVASSSSPPPQAAIIPTNTLNSAADKISLPSHPCVLDNMTIPPHAELNPTLSDAPADSPKNPRDIRQLCHCPSLLYTSLGRADADAPKLPRRTIMELVKRAAAVYLFAAALGVIVQLVFSPFYRNVVGVVDIWHVMNWFMAASLIITVVVRYHDKMQLDREGADSVTRRYLETHAGLIAGVFLALWFFWNWGDVFITSGGDGDMVNSISWVFINPLFVVVTGLAGCRLWTRG